VDPSESEIIRAINSVYREDFKKNIKTFSNPYYKPGTATEIVKIIEKYKTISLEKVFVDL
jgi:UDP-N-acetylglucosamine 2-epimerase